MPSRRKTILFSESGVVSSFDKIIECAGYDIKRLFKCVPQYDYWGESDYFCGGVNYRDLYEEALERKEKFDSKMAYI